jgi:hypothetical protein
MAAKYITNEIKKKKNKETGETVVTTIRYRVDADFVPTSIKEIVMDFVVNYCEANGETEWLLDEVNKPFQKKQVKKDKEGNVISEKMVKADYPFVNLRTDFVKKFFPDIIVGEVKEETWREKLNKKYGR